MTKFRTGNVIRNPYGNIEIVTSCTDEKVNVISFDYENSSGTHKLKDYTYKADCFCCENNDNEYDQDCEFCKGTGSGEKTNLGWEKSTVLASTVKEYIVKALTKNFGF